MKNCLQRCLLGSFSYELEQTKNNLLEVNDHWSTQLRGYS